MLTSGQDGQHFEAEEDALKKLAIFIGVFSLLFTVLLGCSSGSNKVEELNQKPAESSDEQVVLRFWLRGNAEAPIVRSLVADIEAYEALHKNIKIEYEVVAVNDVETKWNAAFAGGTAPDIFDAGIVHIAARANLNQFIPLDDYINGWSEKDDVHQIVYDQGKYEGQVYGLGFGPGTYVFAYRKDFFEEAGLDPEVPPKNWEQLKEYSELLTVREGDTVVRSGFDVARSDLIIAEIFAWQNGGKLVDLDQGTPTFDDPAVIEAIQFMVDNLIPNSIPFPSMQNFEQFPFVNGKAAMTYINQDTILNVIKNNPDLAGKIGVASNVPGKAAATFSGMRTFAISNTSKYKDEAWDFIEFMMSKERMSNRMTEFTVPPVRKSLEEDYIELNPQVNQAIAEAVAIGYGRPAVTWSPLYTKYGTQGYEQAAFGVKPVEQAMKDALADLKKEIGQ